MKSLYEQDRDYLIKNVERTCREHMFHTLKIQLFNLGTVF